MRSVGHLRCKILRHVVPQNDRLASLLRTYLAFPFRPRNVLVKSAPLRFRLRRKLRLLPYSSFSPNKPHVALLRAGFAGGTPFFIIRPRLWRGLTHFGARPLPTKPAPLGFRGDPGRWHLRSK